MSEAMEQIVQMYVGIRTVARLKICESTGKSWRSSSGLWVGKMPN